MNKFTGETEKMLVRQLRNDDALAFDQLYREYSPRLFRFAFSLQKSNEDAREIVQETFYRIWTRRHELDVEKSFKSFVFTISYNLIVDQLRLRLKDQEYRRFIYRKFNLEEEPPPIKADYEIIYRQIDQAIEELPEKRKAIFNMSRRRGMSHREIADEMGISVKTVENQINLSLKHIRMRLGKDILPVLLILALLP